MALAIPAITKLLAQLAVLAPIVNESIERIRQLIEAIRKGGGSTNKELEEHLKHAIELQDSVNKDINGQLQIIRSVLENVQKSLRALSLGVIGTGIIAVLAIVLVLVKQI